MASKPKRGRTERRAVERALRKAVNVTARLLTEAPGGAPDRALTVSTPSVIDGRARSEPCGHCGGQLDLLSHGADGPVLRVVKLVCRVCHAPRTIWFRLEPVRAN